MEKLVMAGQLLLGLTILVGLHEWGHFITARMFKIRVNKFYIFFDFLFPLPNVMNFALWKKKSGDTEYGLGWFPLGGYVDIAGMVDETKDAASLSATPEPWEFRSKPAWQRLIVMLGGIIVNVILGVLIFWILTYKSGGSYLSKDEVNKQGIAAYPLAQQIGLKTGDKIVQINGKDYNDFADVRSSDVILGNNTYYTVVRDGKTIEVPIPNNLIDKISDEKYDGGFIEPIQKFKIREISPESPAEKAGLKAGDKVLTFNGVPITYYHEFRIKLDSNKNKAIDLVVERAGSEIKLKPTIGEDGKLGFFSDYQIKETEVKYSLGEALGVGSKRAFSVITDNIKGFGKIFRGQVAATKALSGPIGIARKMYGGVWDWTRFWLITGMLSMALAFMNLLPIPALDGGHAVLLLFEMASGRKPSEKFQERTQQVGMVILLSLMVFIIFSDVIKAIF
jgi:regulator of sigma E protease